MRLLLDEMYPPALAKALGEVGIDATSVDERRLTGASDAEVFAAAVASGYAVVTENVGDFTRIAAEHITGGGHHPGVVIALSSRFSRRPSGIPLLVAAIASLGDDALEDRIVYLERSVPD